MARKDLVNIKPLSSSFLGCEKDTEKILEALFVKSKPYSDMLKRLLIVNNPDCLDTDNSDYKKLIDSKSLRDLIKEGYIRLNPQLKRDEFGSIKTYILISFDNFTEGADPNFKDYTITFDIMCYLDAWCLNGYQIRPLKVCGYIDGILNNLTDENKVNLGRTGDRIKLSGIGTYEFLSCRQAVLNEEMAMYSLSYRGVHFSEQADEVEHD